MGAGVVRWCEVGELAVGVLERAVKADRIAFVLVILLAVLGAGLEVWAAT